ncbi:MAG: proline/glycine betaine ABC transporter permease [Candidatus Electrothrix sp. MAN1_4]|nr:proline/glycine betaine ABC transporter permease [Candidatus Electrothrix sp. MAN1_4]
MGAGKRYQADSFCAEAVTKQEHWNHPYLFLGGLLDFPQFVQIPLGEWISRFVDWLVAGYGDSLRAVTDQLAFYLYRFESFFRELPWPVTILLIGVLGWHAHRKIRMGIVLAACMLLIGAFGLWDKAMQTLSLMVVSTLISVIIAIPLGIIMSRSDRVRMVFLPFLDAMQTMPSFVYLIPALMLLGLGKVPAIFATVIYAVSPTIRLTDLGIRMVDQEVVEAAESFGAAPREVLFGVQLPLALPSIMAGVNQTTMMALAMVVIASMIGASGLGEEVLLGIQRLDVGRGTEAGVAIVALAVVLDRITQGYGDRARKNIGVS